MFLEKYLNIKLRKTNQDLALNLGVVVNQL